MIFTREELITYCKNFVIPKSKDIKQWELGENFCISFFGTTDEYVLFAGKHLIDVLGFECEETDILKYSYALLTFLMCDTIYSYDLKYLCYTNDKWYHNIFPMRETNSDGYSYNNNFSHLYKNIKYTIVNYKNDKIICKFDKNTHKFKSGSCNKSTCPRNNFACINSSYNDYCNYLINCEGCENCSFLTDSTNCKRCEYCDSCKSLTNCKHCNNCTNCKWLSDCEECKNCTSCKNCKSCNKCKKCILVEDLYNENGIDKTPIAVNKQWKNVKDIEEIIKEENYNLPIVRVLDINSNGWRLECTSKEYILIYDSENTIRFKGRLTNKNTKKLDLNDMFLCCGSVYNEHGGLEGILYISRTKKDDKRIRLSVKDFCSGNEIKFINQYKLFDLRGNVILENKKLEIN